MTLVEVTLQFFDGCPYWRALERQLRQALRQLGLPDSTIMLERVETQKDAKRLAFRGSPTVLVDGVDPFADPALPIGLACRVYRTAEGCSGAPTLSQLVEVLEARS